MTDAEALRRRLGDAHSTEEATDRPDDWTCCTADDDCPSNGPFDAQGCCADCARLEEEIRGGDMTKTNTAAVPEPGPGQGPEGRDSMRRPDVDHLRGAPLTERDEAWRRALASDDVALMREIARLPVPDGTPAAVAATWGARRDLGRLMSGGFAERNR